MESNAHVLLASFAACALLRLTLALSYLAAPVPGAGKPAVHAAAGVVVVVPARSVKPSRVKQGKTAPVSTVVIVCGYNSYKPPFTSCPLKSALQQHNEVRIRSARHAKP